MFDLSHHGRYGRLQFLRTVVLDFIFMILLSALAWALIAANASLIDAKVSGLSVVTALAPGLAISLFSLPVLYSSIVTGIKRLHDLDLSGWWMLWFHLLTIGLTVINPVLGILGLIAQFVAYFLIEGTDGPNRFDRKRATAGTVNPRAGDDQKVSSHGATA